VTPRVLAALVGAVTILGQLLLLGPGRHRLQRSVRRIEQSPQSRPEKLLRLRRAMGWAEAGAVAPLLGLVGFCALSVVGRRPLPAGQKVLLIAGVTLIVGLLCLTLLGNARVGRGAIARVRELPARPRRRRGGLVSGLSGGISALGFDLVRLLPGAGAVHVFALTCGYAVVLSSIPTLLPPLFVRLLGAAPVPPELERSCRELAQRMGVRVRSFRSYPGRSERKATAVQLGVLPRLRYVLISDYLLDQLEPIEVDAVVAHELGHIRGRHLLLKLAAVAGVWALLAGLLSGFAYSVRRPTDALMPILLVLLVILAVPVGLVIVQGLLGIRLEARADAAAADTVGVRALAAALVRTAELNDTKSDPNWWQSIANQHPGLDDRLARLEESSLSGR